MRIVMGKKKSNWKIGDPNTVSYEFDKDHKLLIERITNGFSIKVYDYRGVEGKEEPAIIYFNKLSDSLLGYKGNEG